jgi:hypothetical protein
MGHICRFEARPREGEKRRKHARTTDNASAHHTQTFDRGFGKVAEERSSRYAHERPFPAISKRSDAVTTGQPMASFQPLFISHQFAG